MISLSAQLPSSYPGRVLTTRSPIQPSKVPVSAISASTAASHSQEGPPIMSPDTVVLTTSSSVQPSPKPMHGRNEDPYPYNFQLPESILSRKTSNDLLDRSLASCNPSAMPEASPKSSNLIRRFSNRAHRFASSRQQSSAAPASRNGSIGPSILRCRSDSNTTAPPRPPEYNAVTDTDEEANPVPDGNISLFGLDGATHSSSNNDAAGSINGSGSAKAGPVLPAELRNGCEVLKVSRRSRTRRVNLMYETESNKLSWDPARPHKSLHVDEIKEIRTSPDTHNTALTWNVRIVCGYLVHHHLYRPRNSRTKLLHIITDNEEVLNRWTGFLEATLTYRQGSMTSLMAFDDGAMAIKRVCQNLHIYSSQWTLQTNFRLSDVRRREKLNFTEFRGFIRLMKQRHDVQRIIRSIAAKPETGMTFPEFLAFLRDIQGEDVDSNLSMWEKQFAYLSRRYRPDAVETSDAADDMLVIDYTGASNYTLDRPMNEYIISSSHNTYLLGRQVAGQSSVEGYISVLIRGCRCIEVDCWDGNSGQPEVNHGRTLTTSISFREVIATINKYAFVHCNPNQQAIMVNIMKEAFGSRLLMERILIKVKKPQIKQEPPASNFRGRRRGNSLNSPLTRSVTDAAMLMPSQSLPQSPMRSPSPSCRRPVRKTRVNTITEGGCKIGRTSTKIVKELGDLGVYCAGVNFAGFDAAEAKQYNHIFSFMESSFAKHFRAKEQKIAVDLHNLRYMMRVYPDRTRITSNNFDPLLYWRRGIQMVALNWQTFDLGMQINRAMFDGGQDFSGYVLKPAELRDIQKERSVVSFTIDVISVQRLMRPASLPANKAMNPYVEVEVFHASDKREKRNESALPRDFDPPQKFRTNIVRENGFNPMFDGHFKFKVTKKQPDLVFVRWSVKLSNDGENYNDRPAVATYTAKLSNLKQGYRTLPLLNDAGDQYLFSSSSARSRLIRLEDDNRRTPVRPRCTRPRSTMEKLSTEKISFDSYP
ncbi:PLC-like phosphodiesterase [Fusarium solani]|uniref:Phosphoinositide phospholipase C n=1 Tax=Fusarium solani TaxID=169388 RepID=A0A9P9H1L3_FUSSL|nr:PLC-like phosphodiesterase [Fusarium solani]KAH7248212.1 PLC-like phosphodiesterase [Fusarium solani]